MTTNRARASGRRQGKASRESRWPYPSSWGRGLARTRAPGQHRLQAGRSYPPRLAQDNGIARLGTVSRRPATGGRARRGKGRAATRDLPATRDRRHRHTCRGCQPGQPGECVAFRFLPDGPRNLSGGWGGTREFPRSSGVLATFVGWRFARRAARASRRIWLGIGAGAQGRCQRIRQAYSCVHDCHPLDLMI